MNLLIVGNSDKTETILQFVDLTRPFLMIDDGQLIDALTAPLIEATPIPNRPKIVWLDFSKHNFNPVEGMTYLKARALATTLYTASPQGENTLTVRNGKRALLQLFLAKPKRLNKISRNKKDPAYAEALAAVDEMLLSPLLHRVFCSPSNIPQKHATLLARIDRARIGDFDAFILANFLIGQFQGQVIVPDGGFYLRDHHTLLIRQQRLIGGVNFMAELPDSLRKNLLPYAQAAGRCTWEDAQALANYAGLSKGTVAYTEFVEHALAA